jgi:hypothetical protein
MRLKDIAAFGTNEEVQARLEEIQAELYRFRDALWNRRELEVGCRVYPGIARSTAEQLELLKKHLEDPIEISASVCRTVFEINVVFRYCLSSNERLNAYADQAATDEISIYKSIKQLAEEDTDPNNLKLLDDHMNQIRAVMMKHGRDLKPERATTYQMAKEIGLGDEYDAMYGIYSKYVHASAWFVTRPRDHIDLPPFRLALLVNSQVYSLDTVARLSAL